MQIDSVKKYLTSTVTTPYFLFISDSQYKPVIEELSVLGFEFVQMSDFCGGDDKLPDIDGLLTNIEDADVNTKGKKLVLKGIGEYLALRGNDEASHILSRLKDFNLGGAKVVLILRGLASQIAGLQMDPRFDNRRYSVIDKAECDLSFTLAAHSVGLSDLSGFKAMLAELENGRTGRIAVNTAVELNKSLFTVHIISNAYDGVKFSTLGFGLPRSCGIDTHWAELLAELNKSNSSLDEVFENHGLSGNLESDFYARITGSDYINWLYYICLKSKVDTLQNVYLRFVLEKTSKFEDFISNVLNSIIDIPHTDKLFSSFYQGRKALVEKFPESDIADFVVNNRKVMSESIYKLTDATKVEREEIIAWFSKNGVFPQVGDIYPALADYLKKYVFKCPELADLLTDYFEAYKLQKILNTLDHEFLEKIDELAQSPRKFNHLPTRNEIIDGLDKTDTYLYWLDALGVEYLAFIEALVQKRGLSVRVNIARAKLPTITSSRRAYSCQCQRLASRFFDCLSP